MPLLAALVIGLVALSHIVPGPFLLEAFNPERSLWRMEGEPGHPQALYLTFDDGPNATWTPPLLDASGSPRTSSFPLNSASARPSAVGL